MLLSPSNAAVAVAADHGFFKGVNVSYTQTDYDSESKLFLSRKLPIGFLDPNEVAKYDQQGENLVFISTADSLNFWNGIVVRAKDADKYKSITDLKGKTLGQPGFGTATWLAFSSIATRNYHLNPKSDFKLITADAGALLGLLAKGRVDAVLTFAAQATAALASPDQFHLVTSFSQEWQRTEKQPLVVEGLVARSDWLETHKAAARAIIAGIDQGVHWIEQHPDEFLKGGKYYSWANAEGWFSTKQSSGTVIDLLKKGQWYFDSKLYTNAWIDSAYKFVQYAQGTSVPPKSTLFAPPDL